MAHDKIRFHKSESFPATALNRSKCDASLSRSGRSLTRPGKCMVPFNRLRASSIDPSRRSEPPAAQPLALVREIAIKLKQVERAQLLGFFDRILIGVAHDDVWKM